MLGQEAWVHYNGRFDPCCAPDELRKMLGNFGNISDEGGLMRVWRSKKYGDLVENYMNNEVCKMCNMRKPPAEDAREMFV